MKSFKLLCSMALVATTILGTTLLNGQKAFAEEIQTSRDISTNQTLSKTINFTLSNLENVKLYMSIGDDNLQEVKEDISLNNLDLGASIVFFIAPENGYKVENKNIFSVDNVLTSKSYKTSLGLVQDKEITSKLIKDAKEKGCTDIFWFTKKSSFDFNINTILK